MSKYRSLATVSAIALTAGWMTSAQAATDPNLLIDLDSPSIQTDGAAAAAVIASVSVNGSLGAAASVQGPNVFSGLNDIGGGANVSALVDGNTIFALTVGNEVANEADPGAATGVSADNGLIVGTVSANLGGSLDATVTGALVLNDVEDAGPNNTLSTSSNTISATVEGNTLESFIGRDIPGNVVVDGDIPDGYTSAEQGQITIDDTGFGNSDLNAGGREIEASGSYTVGSVQYNAGLDDPTAGIDGARIALQAVADGGQTTEIVSSDLDVSSNAIEASIDGNVSVNAIDLTAGDPTGFSGSASVANLQANVPNVDDDPFSALVSDAFIEAGDYDGGTEIANLETSTLNVNSNRILAGASANTSDNELNIADGISVAGPNATADAQDNSLAIGGPNAMNLEGDLIIANAQASDTAVDAEIDNGRISAFVDSVLGSDVNLNENEIAATAAMNTANNDLTVGGATTFDAVVGISNLQYVTADSSATVNSSIVSDVGDGDGALGSSINVDRNQVTASATGNDASTTASIMATNIDVDALDAPDDAFIDVRQDNDTADIGADFSILSAQVVDDGAVVDATVNTNILTRIGEGGTVVGVSSISSSNNLISAQAIGNRVRDNSLDIDVGAGFSGTAGVASSQSLVDGSTVTASLNDGPELNDLIGVRVSFGGGDAVGADSIDVDSNTISATVIGNLIDAETNSLSIDGTTITDGGQDGTFGPSGSVARNFVPDLSPNIATDSGFGIVTEQLVSDLGGNVAVELDQGAGPSNAIQVNVGSTDATVNTSAVSVDDNTVTLSATLNQAATEANIGGDGTTLIDGSTALVNAQSVVDSDDDGVSANIDVFVDWGGDIQVTVQTDTDPLTASSLTANRNDIFATGRVNVASNTINIEAVNQEITNVNPDFDPLSGAAGQSLTTTSAFGETTLVNDQFAAGGDNGDDPFVSVRNGAFRVDPMDEDLGAGVVLAVQTVDGDVTADSITVNENEVRSLASVNTASNEINLDIQNFDLSDAADGGGPRNGPVATLVSSQSAVDIGEGGTVVSLVADADIRVDLANVGGSLSSANLEVNDNVLQSAATSNTVFNTLDVAGTSFVNPVAGDPTAQVGDVAVAFGFDFVFSDTVFALGSTQLNQLDVIAAFEDSDIVVRPDVAGTIDSSGISASGNLITAEATGNQAVNSASTDFTTNHAGMMVVNFQANDVVVIEATVNGDNPTELTDATTIRIDAAIGDDPDISNTSLTVDNNAILALANGNTANNRIDVDGGSLYGAGLEAATDPSIVVDASPGAVADITVNADIGLVSSQVQLVGVGSVTALVDEAQIAANAAALLDGVSVSVVGNQIGAQAVAETATNVIAADLSANVGEDGDEPTIALVNRQIMLSFVSATVIDANIGSIEGDNSGALIDTSDVGSASLTVDNNSLVAFAEGGRATNLLSVVAGANIEGDADRQTGTAPVLTVAGPASTDEDSIYTADYALLNVQAAIGPVTAIIQPDGVDNDVGRTGIGIQTAAGVENDAYTVDNNVINARALGVVANNVLVMDAGATSSATAQLGNGQANLGPVTATIDGSSDGSIDFAAELDGDVTNSSLSVDNNQMAAVAQANTASNILLASSGSGFQESSGLSFQTDDGNGDRVVTNADIVVFNQQQAFVGPFTTEVASSVTDASAGIDLGTGGALSNATLTVDGNAFTASSIANDAVNAVALNSDLSARPSVAVISIQTTENRTISATTSNVTIGITGVTGAANSSSSVSGNRVGATAIGNRSFSSIGQ